MEDGGAFNTLNIAEERPRSSSGDSFNDVPSEILAQNEEFTSTGLSDLDVDHLTPQGNADSPSVLGDSARKVDGNLGHEGSGAVEPIESLEISSERGAQVDEQVDAVKMDISKDEGPFPAIVGGDGVVQIQSHSNTEEVEQPEPADVDLEAPSHEEEKQLDMSGEPVCTVGNELELLVALPDRYDSV